MKQLLTSREACQWTPSPTWTTTSLACSRRCSSPCQLRRQAKRRSTGTNGWASIPFTARCPGWSTAAVSTSRNMVSSFFSAAANVFVHPVVLLSVAVTAGRELLSYLKCFSCSPIRFADCGDLQSGELQEESPTGGCFPECPLTWSLASTICRKLNVCVKTTLHTFCSIYEHQQHKQNLLLSKQIVWSAMQNVVPSVPKLLLFHSPFIFVKQPFL